MRRGSTPVHEFQLPFEASELVAAYVTYEQDKKKVLEKTLADFTLEGDMAYYTLTQEETLAFDEGKPVQIQFDYRTRTGKRFPSTVFTVPVERVLKAEVI